MLLEEFDMDEYIKMERRDSYEDGHEDGLAEANVLSSYTSSTTCFKKASLPKTAPTCLMKTQILSIKYILCAMLTLTGQMKIFTMH